MSKELTTSPQAAANFPARKSKAFRDGLLARLPLLSVSNWESKDAFDVQQDLASLGDIGADSLLEPLAPLAKTRGD